MNKPDPVKEMYRILAANDGDRNVAAGKMMGGMLYALYTLLQKTYTENIAMEKACNICITYQLNLSKKGANHGTK